MNPDQNLLLKDFLTSDLSKCGHSDTPGVNRLAECVKLGMIGLVGRGTQLYTVTAKHTLTINFKTTPQFSFC